MENLIQEVITYAGDDYTENQRTFVESLVIDAIEEIIHAMYPFGLSGDAEEEKAKKQVLKRYRSTAKKIAQYHYDKQGKEGVQSYSENGTSANYESSGTPSSYLQFIIPVSRVI